MYIAKLEDGYIVPEPWRRNSFTIAGLGTITYLRSIDKRFFYLLETDLIDSQVNDRLFCKDCLFSMDRKPGNDRYCVFSDR